MSLKGKGVVIIRGHLAKKGSKWYIVVDIGYNENGKRKQKWISGFTRKKDAEKQLAEILQRINNNSFFVPQDMPLEEYLNKWINDYAKPNVAPTTFQKYIYSLEKVVAIIGEVKMNKLKPYHIQEMMNELNKSKLGSSTITTVYNVLNNALEKAVLWEIITNNPCRAISPPKQEKKEMKILNQEEVLILLKNLKEPLRLVVLIAINTGLRRGEILGLEWSNVDFENKKIHIVNSIVNIRGKALRKETKTSAGRRAISISKSLISELKKTMTKQKENKLWFGADYFGNDYVCVWENGKEINPNYITQAFRKSIMKLEIPHIRFHDLRHTHASLLLQKGKKDWGTLK